MAEKKKQEEVKKKPRKEKYENQLKWIFMILGIIILISLIFYFIIESTKKFEYGGIKFQKIMYDKLPLFYSRIPISDQYGNLKVNYNLYLRNDPRKLRDVAIDGIINLDDSVRISLDRASESECDGRESLMGLAQLISGIGYSLKTGFNDKELAEEKNISYFTCENSDAGTTTLVFKSSNQTKITLNGRCYTLEFADCKLREVTERFIVGWIVNTKGTTI